MAPKRTSLSRCALLHTFLAQQHLISLFLNSVTFCLDYLTCPKHILIFWKDLYQSDLTNANSILWVFVMLDTFKLRRRLFKNAIWKVILHCAYLNCIVTVVFESDMCTAFKCIFIDTFSLLCCCCYIGLYLCWTFYLSWIIGWDISWDKNRNECCIVGEKWEVSTAAEIYKCQKLYSALRKYLYPFVFSHLLSYCLILNYFKLNFPPSAIYTPYTIMAKQKTDICDNFANLLKISLENSIYSGEF